MRGRKDSICAKEWKAREWKRFAYVCTRRNLQDMARDAPVRPPSVQASSAISCQISEGRAVEMSIVVPVVVEVEVTMAEKHGGTRDYKYVRDRSNSCDPES